MRYTTDDHAALMVYLASDPHSCYQVAKKLGYSGKPPGAQLEPGQESMEYWFTNIIFQFWLSDQPGGKRGGAPDARKWLAHVLPPVPSLNDLVEEVARQVDEDRNA